MIHSADNCQPRRSRRGAVALEFCIVSALLFTIFLAMIEVGRAMMVLGALANAARVSARAGAVTSGDYTAITSAAQTALTQAQISTPADVVVTVNGANVQDNQGFTTAAVPGAQIVVRVGVAYSRVSWLPAGTGMFIPAKQMLTQTAVLIREG